MSNSTLSAMTWFGLPAWRLEDERLQVVCVPALGGKLVSLVDTIKGWEWLAPPRSPDSFARRAGRAATGVGASEQAADSGRGGTESPSPPAGSQERDGQDGDRVADSGTSAVLPYGASFLEYSLFGWDEMFPTINAGPYPLDSSPYTGRSLPDHGEVWTLPWQQTPGADGELCLAVDGVALPYRLSRSLAITAPGRMAMRYRLECLDGEPFAYLWAAHPLFKGGPQVQIVLPYETSQVVNVVSGHPQWGAAEQRHLWPIAVDGDGAIWQLDRLREAHHHAASKFYLPPEAPASWGALRHVGLGCELRLSWNPASLPYLGIWVDEGMHTPTTTVALEPTNGYYDGLETAFRNGRAGRLPPGEAIEWELHVNVCDYEAG